MFSINDSGVNYDEKIEEVFVAIRKNLSEDVVKRIQAVYQFNVKGEYLLLNYKQTSLCFTLIILFFRPL